MYLGDYYTGGVATYGSIQCSDYYSSADHAQNLCLNPIGGAVAIGNVLPAYTFDVTGTMRTTGGAIFEGNMQVGLRGSSNSSTNPRVILQSSDLNTSALTFDISGTNTTAQYRCYAEQRPTSSPTSPATATFWTGDPYGNVTFPHTVAIYGSNSIGTSTASTKFSVAGPGTGDLSSNYASTAAFNVGAATDTNLVLAGYLNGTNASVIQSRNSGSNTSIGAGNYSLQINPLGGFVQIGMSGALQVTYDNSIKYCQISQATWTSGTATLTLISSNGTNPYSVGNTILVTDVGINNYIIPSPPYDNHNQYSGIYTVTAVGGSSGAWTVSYLIAKSLVTVTPVAPLSFCGYVSGMPTVQTIYNMLDDGTGRMGVGTLYPDSRYSLDVTGNVRIGSASSSVGYLTIGNATVQNNMIELYPGNSGITATNVYGLGVNGSTMRYNSQADHAWFTIGTEFMRIKNTTGYVGIGTSSPSYALDVTGTIRGTTVLAGNMSLAGNTLSSTNTNGNINLTPNGTGSTVFSSDFYSQSHGMYLRGVGDLNHGIIWASDPDGPNFFGNLGHKWLTGGQSGTERMRLNSTGLGIGTSSPATTLQVNGVASANSFACYNGASTATSQCFGYNTCASTAGSQHTAIGSYALNTATGGTGNVAVGYAAMLNCTAQQYNTAIGYDALFRCASNYNVAVGASTLNYLTSGGNNIAIGYSASYSATTAADNIAIGLNALTTNLSGYQNVTIGNGTMQSATSSSNVAIGHNTMHAITTGNSNTAIGCNSLNGITTGYANVAIGIQAGNSVLAGNNNIFIGNSTFASTDTSNCIVISSQLITALGSNSIAIGFGATPSTTCYIDGIYGASLASGSNVVINSSGHLGTIVSSAKYKTDILPITSEKYKNLLDLNPVSFYMKVDVDKKEINYGLIAEDVAKILPELVHYREDKNDGILKPETVYYQYLPPMLLGVCKELKAENTTLCDSVKELKTENIVLQDSIKELKSCNTTLYDSMNELKTENIKLSNTVNDLLLKFNELKKLIEDKLT